jgi:hypothetical protein
MPIALFLSSPGTGVDEIYGFTLDCEDGAIVVSALSSFLSCSKFIT